MKKKRSKWNSTRLFNIHKNIFIVLNMIIWFNMFLVLVVMNPDISFSSLESFIVNSISVAIGLIIALVVHYIAHNRYLASKWQRYEQQQGAYNTDTQMNDEGNYQHDFSHLKDRYEQGSVDSEEDPIDLKNGNRI